MELRFSNAATMSTESDKDPASLVDYLSSRGGNLLWVTAGAIWAVGTLCSYRR